MEFKSVKKLVFCSNPINSISNKTLRPETIYRLAAGLEKLILQNPSFLPHDSFSDTFEHLRSEFLLPSTLFNSSAIQIRFAPDENTAWDKFVTAPSLDFSMQFEIQNWAQNNNNYSITARLFQMMEATDSVRFNSQTIMDILSFTEKMIIYPVSDATKLQMIHIAKSILGQFLKF